MKPQEVYTEFLSWAQMQIPVIMKLVRSSEANELQGTLFTAKGELNLRLLFSDKDNSFFFEATRGHGEISSFSITTKGYWPTNQETLASVLASLPRKAN